MQPYEVKVNETKYSIEPLDAEALDLIENTDGSFHILKNQKAYRVEVAFINKDLKTFTFHINGSVYTAEINDKYDRLIDQLGMKVGAVVAAGNIKAPMPGLVLEIAVEVGQSVVKGDKVLILEAMKMENVIKASGDGIVKVIHVSKGTAVDKGQLLIEL